MGVALVAALVRPLGGQPVRHLPLDRRGGESAQVVLVPLPRFQRQRSRVGRNDEHCEEKQTQQHGGSRSVLVLSPAQGQPGPRHPLGFAGTAEHKHHLPAVQPHPAPRRQGETATALAHVILQLHSAPVHPKRAAHLRRHVHQIVLAPGGDQRQRGAANHFLRHRRVGVRGGADHVLCRPRPFACAAGLVQVVGGDELAAEKRLDFQSIANPKHRSHSQDSLSLAQGPRFRCGQHRGEAIRIHLGVKGARRGGRQAWTGSQNSHVTSRSLCGPICDQGKATGLDCDPDAGPARSAPNHN